MWEKKNLNLLSLSIPIAAFRYYFNHHIMVHNFSTVLDFTFNMSKYF